MFDKCRQDTNSSPNQSIIELRALSQALLQRVHELELAQKDNVKSIQSLKKTISGLQSENISLSGMVEKLQSEFTAHATGCETYRKTTKSHLKRLDGLDFTEYEVLNKRYNAEIARLSKVCVNLQKQVSEKKTQRLYSTTISPSKAPSTSCAEFKETTHLADYHIDNSIEETDKAVCASPAARDTVTVISDQDVCVHIQATPVNEHENNEENNSNTGKTDKVNSTYNKQTHDTIKDRSTRYSHITNTVESQPSEFETSSTNNKDIHSTKIQYNQSKHSSDDEDIFEGVSYKRNARYYLSGMGHRSTQLGMVNFLNRKGITVSHFVFFKPKYPGSRRNAKINVAPSDAQIVEAPGFWPRGISCRPWLSEREWDKKLSRSDREAENHDRAVSKNWDSEQNVK